MAGNKQTAGNLKRTAGPGRPKGSPNKTTALLKDAILKAATEAGGKAGLVGYLRAQATDNPGPFLSLLGKVLPLQVANDDGGAIVVQIVKYADNPTPSE